MPLDAELIVIDDGSSHSVNRQLARRVTGDVHFLLRCNNIFEIRAYNRAIAASRGEYIALLQDDDLYVNEEWWRRALELMEDDPSIGVCGGMSGMSILPPDNVQVEADPLAHKRRYPDRFDDDGLYTWPGIVKLRVWPGSAMGSPKYVDVINRAPMLLRRSTYDAIGPFDEEFAPFQADDADFCLRAWKAGWRVVLYDSQVRDHAFEGGMRQVGSDQVSMQSYRNHLLLYERHGDFIDQGGCRSLLGEASDSVMKP